jgi:hypothetical protein
MSIIYKESSYIEQEEIDAASDPTPDQAPAPAPGPSPKILFLGAHPRVIDLILLYRLQENPDFALSDRRTEVGGSQLHFQHVFPFDQLGLDKLEAVVITEDPVFPSCKLGSEAGAVPVTKDKTFSFNEYMQASKFLKEMGVPPEKIITTGQPGKVHRALSKFVDLSPEENRQIGYQAIRRNIFYRGNYAYCMVLAAETALRMSLTKVSVIEFGVWFGAGLKNLCEIADFLQQTLGIEFLIYGFDTGAGLPEVADWRDHPELWPSGSLAMPNFEELKSQLPDNCRLIIGDVKDTLPTFLEQHASAEAPIGFVSLDVDQYHSSVSALKVFDADPTHLTPAVPIWVDDSHVGVLQTTYAGEGLAIREFNDQHPLRKIEQKIVRTDDYPRIWHHCIYFAHIFDHPVRQGKATARFDQFYHTNY